MCSDNINIIIYDIISCRHDILWEKIYKIKIDRYIDYSKE